MEYVHHAFHQRYFTDPHTDEICGRFKWFAKFHELMALRPNVTPICVTTDIGPSGPETVYIQEPDDDILPFTDVTNFEDEVVPPEAQASARTLLEAIQLAQAEKDQAAAAASATPPVTPDTPGSAPTAPPSMPKTPSTAPMPGPTLPSTKKSKSKTKPKPSVFSVKTKRSSGKQTLESMLKSSLNYATQVNFAAQARQQLIDNKKLELDLYKEGIRTVDELKERLDEIDLRMKELQQLEKVDPPALDLGDSDSESGDD
jgi:hypothetical protein